MEERVNQRQYVQFDVDAKIATTRKRFEGLTSGLVFGLVFSTIVAYISINDSDQDLVQVSHSKSVSVINSHQDDYLYNNVRVLCMMLPVRKDVLNDRGRIFMETWAKRCNIFIFFSDDEDSRFNVVVLKDKRSEYSKLREALVYIYKNHYKDFDWILKCNDNTYMVMENLRWLLFQYDAKWPLMIGQRLNKFPDKSNTIEAVYALSKEALSRIIENGFGNSLKCSFSPTIMSDSELSRCAHSLNIVLENAVDEEGRSMFFLLHPENLLLPDKELDLSNFWHKAQTGPKCCSDRLTAIVNIWNAQLYDLEYYIYKVHVFGRHRVCEPLPRKKTLEDVLRNY